MSRVGISGANGYVGSAIAESFISKGWDVIALTRRAPTDARMQWLPFELRRKPNLEAFRLQPFDVLVHAAYDFSAARPQDIYTANVQGSLNLLDAVAETGKPRVIHVSSASSFKGTASIYGRTKFAVEQRVLSRGGAAIRPGLVYGGTSGGMMKKFRELVCRRRWVPALTTGERSLRLVHSQDLGELCVRIAEGLWPPRQPLVVAGGTRAWTLADVLRHLASEEGMPIRVVPFPWPLAWVGMKLLEALGLRLAFRSDSILSLVRGNPDMADPSLRPPDFHFREFGAA